MTALTLACSCQASPYSRPVSPPIPVIAPLLHLRDLALLILYDLTGEAFQFCFLCLTFSRLRHVYRALVMRAHGVNKLQVERRIGCAGRTARHPTVSGHRRRSWRGAIDSYSRTVFASFALQPVPSVAATLTNSVAATTDFQ